MIVKALKTFKTTNKFDGELVSYTFSKHGVYDIPQQHEKWILRTRLVKEIK